MSQTIYTLESSEDGLYAVATSVKHALRLAETYGQDDERKPDKDAKQIRAELKEYRLSTITYGGSGYSLTITISAWYANY